jgi:hypothetical protein
MACDRIPEEPGLVKVLPFAHRNVLIQRLLRDRLGSDGLRRWVPKLRRAKRHCSTKSVVIILCALIGLSADTLRNGGEIPNQSSKAVSDRG